jgi:hypothetical protein
MLLTPSKEEEGKRMPKHSWLIAGIATCLLVAACVSSPPKGRIRLVTQSSFTTEPYRGTFEVTKGAEVLGCERGSFVDTPAGITIFKELTCESGARSGTFTAIYNPDAPGPGDRNGQWSIAEAADDFSGLDGGGEFSAVVDEGWRTGIETLTGNIQFSSEAVKANPAPTLAPTRKARLELRLVASGPGPGLSEMRDLDPSQPVYVRNTPVITNADIAHARATRYAGAPAVGLAFTKTGANTLCDITTANIGKPIGVLVDGKLVNVATIRERLTCGARGWALITGNFSHDDAKRIAATFPAEPADPLTINSVWQGTGQQSKPALTYPMILFVQQRWGDEFEGITWYPTLGSGLSTVKGRIEATGVVTLSEDEVIFGEATEQRLGIVAGAKYMAKLGKTTLEGNGEWTDPTTKDVATLTFLLRLAQ